MIPKSRKPKQRIIADPPPRVPSPIISFGRVFRPFAASDLQSLHKLIPARDRRRVDTDEADKVVDRLNEGVRAYLTQARRDRVDTAEVATEWNRKVNRKARELLAALGVRPLHKPQSFQARPPIHDELDFEIGIALASETETSHWRSYLKLPSSFGDAVFHSIGAIWYLAHISDQAAAMYDARKKRDRGQRRSRDPDELDAQELFVLHLARVYEQLSVKKLPKNVYVGVQSHPFVNFCRSAFRITASRAPKSADSLDQDDISDFEALKEETPSSIQGNLMTRVHKRLTRPPSA